MRDLMHIDQLRVLYQLPGMKNVGVRTDIVYTTVEGETFQLDVWYPLDMPPETTDARDAVIFVHGGPQPEQVAYINQSQPSVSCYQLIAASRLIAVMFKHRTDDGYTRLSEAAS